MVVVDASPQHKDLGMRFFSTMINDEVLNYVSINVCELLHLFAVVQHGLTSYVAIIFLPLSLSFTFVNVTSLRKNLVLFGGA